MATIKEEEMASKNDCKYVRALDADGNSIRISKEDLAKVLGELIGLVSNNKDGLMPHNGFILRNDVQDLNNMESGFALINDRVTNQPSGLSWNYGIAVTFRTQSVIYQLFASSENGFYSRVMWDYWLPWVRL